MHAATGGAGISLASADATVGTEMSTAFGCGSAPTRRRWQTDGATHTAGCIDSRSCGGRRVRVCRTGVWGHKTTEQMKISRRATDCGDS